MEKYLQICDYLESHLSETKEPYYVEGKIKEYRNHVNCAKILKDTRFYDYETKRLRDSLAQQFYRLIKRNKDYAAYKKINGTLFPLLRPKNEVIWTKKEIGRKVYKKNGDFDSIDVSFYFSHFQSNDDVIRENIVLMQKEAIKSAYEKLNKTPLNSDIPLRFLEVKRCVYRKHFDEVLITIGLRKDILDLKEKIETGKV